MTPTSDPTSESTASSTFTLIALAGLFASALIYVGTHWGPWAYSDGVGYIVSARNLVDGIGLGLISPSGQFEPLISHPPLYPTLLASFSWLNIDPLEAARWVDVASGFSFVVATSGILYWITKSRWFALSSAFILALTPSLLLMFLSAMAEPLSLALSIPGLLLLVQFRLSGKRELLYLAAALTALSLLARYPNASVVAAGAVYLAIRWNQQKGKLKDSITFTAISLAPTLLFIVWSRWGRQAELPRALAAAEGSRASVLAFVRDFAATIWRWKPIPSSAVVEGLLGPGQSSAIPLLLAALLGIALLVLLLSKMGLKFTRFRDSLAHTRGAISLLILSVLYVIAYLGLLALSYFGTYPTPDIDFRTVLPIMPSLLMIALLLLDLLRRAEPINLIGNVSHLFAVLVILTGYGFSTADLIRGHFRTGAGYTGKAWQESATMDFLSTIDDESPLVSNAPEAILLYHNRYPHDFAALQAEAEDPSSGCPEWVQSIIQQQGGILVLFDITADPSERGSSMAQVEGGIIAACDLNSLAKLEDGSVFADG